MLIKLKKSDLIILIKSLQKGISGNANIYELIFQLSEEKLIMRALHIVLDGGAPR